jgi:RNA polymerase sigma-70 factor (ECF subfamily)
MVIVASLTSLAIAARDGDRRALGRFVEESQADVWRYCAYLTDVQSADDVTQDTYTRAIGSLHRFRGESDAKVWLLSIARRAAADHLRARSRRWRLVERLRSEVSDDPTSSSGTSLELSQLVESLDPDRRDAFVLTQVLGLSYDETAQICGCPIGTVRSRVARARDVLAEVVTRAERATGT